MIRASTEIPCPALFSHCAITYIISTSAKNLEELEEDYQTVKLYLKYLDEVSKNKFTNNQQYFPEIHAAIAVHLKMCVPTPPLSTTFRK